MLYTQSGSPAGEPITEGIVSAELTLGRGRFDDLSPQSAREPPIHSAGAASIDLDKAGDALILRIARTRLHSEMLKAATRALRLSLNQLIGLPLRM